MPPHLMCRAGGPGDQVLGCAFALHKISELLLPVGADDGGQRYQDLLLKATAGQPVAGAGR
jgi:hypothetical protein